MKYTFKPKSDLEKFGYRVYNALVENFSRTYLVGGTVRDLLLNKKIKDIDIATIATPAQVAETLKKYFIEYNIGYIKMGIIIATNGKLAATIATFRKEIKTESRYPKIKFVKSALLDSQRRDFTINALYLSLKNHKILDFHNGLKDLKNKSIKFIGNPIAKIKEDPLRIIRALRFSLELNFKLEKKTKFAIKKYFHLTHTLSESRLKKEINKLKLKNKLFDVVSNPQLLDKFL